MRVEAKQAGDRSASTENRGVLANLLHRRGMQMGLGIILLVLFWGAWSWVQFGRSLEGDHGLYTQSDFPAVTIVSRMISEGHGSDIYNLTAQLEGQRRLIADNYIYLDPSQELKYPYPYTPFIALVLSPLSGLDPNITWLVWDVLNVLGMAIGLWYLLGSLALSRNNRLLLLLAGLTSFPFIVNLEQGQSSGIVILALGLGLGLLKRGKELPAGLALGLLAVKVQWLPFIVLALALQRQWKALAGIVATGAALLSTSVLIMGTGWIPGYIDMLAMAQNYARELLLDPWYSHSLSGGITALIGGDTDAIVRMLNLAAMLAAAVLLIWAWRGKTTPQSTRWDAAMALTILAAMFTNPMLNTHDLSLLVLPGALGLAYLTRSPQGRATAYWGGLLWSLYVVTAFFLSQVFTLPLRLTTLAMLLLMISLVSVLRSESAKPSLKAIPSADNL